MKYKKEGIIGQMVAEDYRTAAVFKKFGIDFCCQGNRTIEDACVKKGASVEEILKLLNNVETSSTGQGIDFDSWPLDLLTDYIEKKHHRFVVEKSAEIRPFLKKIVEVHGQNHPELLEIKNEFEASLGELTMHMQREELLLFPFIRKLLEAKSKGKEKPKSLFGSVENPIQQMQNEHHDEGERYRKISRLSNEYIAPLDACNTYKVSYALLREFEDDLHFHIHLENNILFPKAMELEKSFGCKMEI